MLQIIASIIAYISLYCFFYFEFNKYYFNKYFKIVASLILSIPACNITSILFILELHFVIISIIVEAIKKLLRIRHHKRRSFYVIIPISLILSVGLTFYGSYNMHNIIKTEYDITTNKTLSKNYKIALLADVHYPNTMNKDKLSDIISKINKEDVDLLVLAGDIIDEFTTTLQREELFSTISKITKDTKVVYVFGNHDCGNYSINNHISKANLTKMIEGYGIDVLCDENIIIDNEINIIGRDDYNNRDRMTTSEYDTNDNLYNIMIDHQPKDLKNAKANDIDLHLSGHTHSGQMFPMYYIYEMLKVNELNYGLEMIDDMAAINTSGLAGWGFPLRTDHHSEYVIVNIRN